MFLLLAWEMSSFSFSAAMHFKLIKLVLNRSSPKMRIQSLKSGEVLFSPDRDNRFLQIVFALSRRPQVPFLKLLCTLAFNLSINMAINPPVQFLLMCLSFPFLSLPLAFSKIDFPSDQRPPYPPAVTKACTPNTADFISWYLLQSRGGDRERKEVGVWGSWLI